MSLIIKKVKKLLKTKGEMGLFQINFQKLLSLDYKKIISLQTRKDMNLSNEILSCPICKRESSDKNLFEFHHLEPIASRRRTNAGVQCCCQCADQLHLLFSNTELRLQLNSLNLLLGNEKLQKYTNWVKNKPLTSLYSTATKKRKK